MDIEILGFQPVGDLKYYIMHDKAFVFSALEDFGIIHIEAHACGTPVIAYTPGKVLETINGFEHFQPTGVISTSQTVEDISKASNLRPLTDRLICMFAVKRLNVF